MKRAVITALVVALASLPAGSTRAEKSMLNPWVDMGYPRIFNAIERSLLSGKKTELTKGAFVCKTQWDIDDVLWEGGLKTFSMEQEKVRNGQCMFAPAGSKMRLLDIVGWANSMELFYCEYKVELFVGSSNRPSPGTWFVEMLPSPLLATACHSLLSL